ncbi:lipopolysaccharide biosynthesis protein [Acinetobacter haemolyticus]|uniref:lipopolysaccharide biosynthesis protein n=1 Tax=Acinetobacter haemolyticus TaxID=29430 RepID=UPI001372838F|nr:oligosaccharide flippase family protein [Acinetobacter haemolyticus]NAS07487.1 oligosaccharide flippase family protein [Acinetobacter haemolyticus]
MSFLKKAAKFGSGVILAQLITAASIPLLSRLYSPEDFSFFGMLFSISAILVAFVTLRLETLLPKEEDAEVDHKLNVVINVAYLTFLPLLFSATFLLYFVNNVFKSEDLIWGVFIVLAAITFSLFNTINILNVRRDEMALVNKARVSRSTLSVIFQSTLFNIKGGLFLGEVIARFFGLVFLCKKEYFRFNLKLSIKLIKEKINYIKYVLTSNFFNILGLNIYPIIILKFYDPFLVGKFFFVQKILSAPVTMVAQSVSIALLGDFKKIIKSDKNILVKKMNKISFILFFSSFLVFLVSALFFKYFEVLIFGIKWEGIYQYVFILIPFLVGQVAFSPFSQMLLLVGGEKKQFLWDISRLVLVLLSIFIPLFLNVEDAFTISLYIFSVANFFMYLIHYFILIDAIRGFSDD